jgi:hypothetical protein
MDTQSVAMYLQSAQLIDQCESIFKEFLSVSSSTN